MGLTTLLARGLQCAAAAALIAGATGTAAAQVSYQPGPLNPHTSNESASGTGIASLQAQVTVGGVEPAIIHSMTVDHQGTLDDATDIAAVHLYLDVNGNGYLDPGVDAALSTNQSFAVDDGTVTFGSLNRTIANGSSELWLVVVDLNGNGSQGEHWRTHLGTSTTLTATGATSGNALTVTGVSVNSGSKKINTSNCTLTLVGTTVTQPTTAPAPGTVAYPMARLELRASTAMGVKVTSLTFTASGTGDDLIDIAAVRLFRDADMDGALTIPTDPEIGGSGISFNMDDGTAPFASLNETVPAGGRLWLIVAYDWAAAGITGGTYTVSVASANDITRCGVSAHTCTTSSCQLHGIPTTHPPTTVSPGGNPTTNPNPGGGPGSEPVDDPYPDEPRTHKPSYCCAVLPGAGGGLGGAGGALQALLFGWGPLLLLAGLLLALRNRETAPAVRRVR
jgi:hypothetical protein